MNNALVTTQLEDFSRYKINAEVDPVTNILNLNFILAGATFGDTGNNIRRFIELSESGLVFFTVIKKEIIRDRPYRNVYVLFGEDIELRVGSLPTVDIEGQQFGELFEELFVSYLNDDNTLLINALIGSLIASDVVWNNQSTLLEMSISLDVSQHTTEPIPVPLEETIDTVNLTVPEEKILTDHDTLRILRIFTLAHFLEQGLYLYTAEAMNLQQEG